MLDSGNSPCFIIDSQHCHFYRIWLEADFLKSYEVRRITGVQCEYTLLVEQSGNGTTETLDVRGQATTSTGIAIQVMGALDQHTQLVNTHLISRVGNPQESYIERASDPSRPVAGTIGDIQANTSMTKSFIFDERMFSCNFYEDSMSCQRQTSYLSTMIESKKNALPMTAAWHYLQVDRDGRLTSDLMHSAPVIVNLQFTNFRFHLETQTVCPKFTEAELKISGCFACDPLATLELEAFSACAPGLVDVHFEKLIVHTRALHLKTQAARLRIKFKTDMQCVKEKLCLKGRTVTTCKVLDFCLDQPSVELVHPNLTYIKAQALAAGQPWNSEWLPMDWTFSATGVFKLIIAALTSMILLLFLLSTVLTCCRN